MVRIHMDLATLKKYDLFVTDLFHKIMGLAITLTIIDTPLCNEGSSHIYRWGSWRTMTHFSPPWHQDRATLSTMIGTPSWVAPYFGWEGGCIYICFNQANIHIYISSFMWMALSSLAPHFWLLVTSSNNFKLSFGKGSWLTQLFFGHWSSWYIY